MTYATASYLPSLAQWFGSVLPRLKTDPSIKARVYLGDDVDSLQTNILRSEYPQVEFEHLPTTSVKVAGFPDLWEPQHFAWKLWIYQQIVKESALAGTLVWYMDCASLILRLPEQLLKVAKKEGLCMLEDPTQINQHWCHGPFCKALNPSPEELVAQQIVGGIMAFVVGAPLAWKVFEEAWTWGMNRQVIVGPKWSGLGSDGKPFGHRHDQSILSILRLRHKVPVEPLYSVYNDESLRRAFKVGASLYIHRGQLKEHVNFANHIGETHIVSLGRRKDRIEKFKANHEAWTKAVCLRPAVDGRAVKLTPNLARLFAPNDFFWKKAVMGCALSHLSLWLELASEQACCENYLILEDDVKFQAGWMEKWKEASKTIPDGYDILYLGGVLPPNKEGFEKVLEPINAHWSRIAPNQIFGQVLPSRNFHFCTYAYILTREGAQKILQGIAQRGGWHTSTDHILGQRMNDLNVYISQPLLAGCYQDDDPKYVNSQFNDFSRIDEIDSDLWNNDDRFSQEEIKICLENWSGGGLNLQDAIKDAYKVVELIKVVEEKPSSRFVTLEDYVLDPEGSFEGKWLKSLLGDSFSVVNKISKNHIPLKNNPIFIVARPHYKNYLPVFQQYEASGTLFYVIQLSDEFVKDPVDWISYKACKGVIRTYAKAGFMENPKVLTIPLGPNCWPSGSKSLDKNLVWSFFGTKWMDREAKLAPWKNLEPNSYTFYDDWLDAKQLPANAYSTVCARSIFMPCPRGQNPECYRIYEALEHEAIPVLVRENGDEEFFQLLTRNIPILFYNNWLEAMAGVESLLQKPQTLNQYKQTLMIKWSQWKDDLRKNTRSLFGLFS